MCCVAAPCFFLSAAVTVVIVIVIVFFVFFGVLLQWAVRNIPLRHRAEKATLEASRENGQRLVGRAQQQGSFHQPGLLRNPGRLVAVPRSQQGQSGRNAFETRLKRGRNALECRPGRVALVRDERDSVCLVSPIFSSVLIGHGRRRALYYCRRVGSTKRRICRLVSWCVRLCVNILPARPLSAVALVSSPRCLRCRGIWYSCCLWSCLLL